MIKEYQVDPVRGNLIHADFVRIQMDEVIEVDVPVQATGEAAGVKLDGGILDHVTRQVRVSCLPGDIPEHIVIDVTPAPPGLCGQYPSYLFSDLGWVGTRIFSRDFTDAPGFAWNGVWVVKLSIPGNATSTQTGQIAVVEYGGPPTSRELTISRVPCDFRPDDPTGNNGPFLRDEGNAPTEYFVLGSSSGGKVGLMPGVDYYVNIRNWQIQTNQISCDPSIFRCEALFFIQLPR